MSDIDPEKLGKLRQLVEDNKMVTALVDVLLTWQQFRASHDLKVLQDCEISKQFVESMTHFEGLMHVLVDEALKEKNVTH